MNVVIVEFQLWLNVVHICLQIIDVWRFIRVMIDKPKKVEVALLYKVLSYDLHPELQKSRGVSVVSKRLSPSAMTRPLLTQC